MPTKKLGTNVTAWVKLKSEIRKKGAELEDLKSQAEEFVKPIIKLQKEAGNLKRTDVAIGSATLKEEIFFKVTDWEKVWKYVFKTKDTALFQKRLANAFLRELDEEGIKIPGTKKYTKKSLSVGYKKGV